MTHFSFGATCSNSTLSEKSFVLFIHYSQAQNDSTLQLAFSNSYSSLKFMRSTCGKSTQIPALPYDINIRAEQQLMSMIPSHLTGYETPRTFFNVVSSDATENNRVFYDNKNYKRVAMCIEIEAAGYFEL